MFCSERILASVAFPGSNVEVCYLVKVLHTGVCVNQSKLPS